MSVIVNVIEGVYFFLWGDWIKVPFINGSISIPLLVLLLLPAGIFFTCRTRFIQIRMLPDMVMVTLKTGEEMVEHDEELAMIESGKKPVIPKKHKKSGLSALQSLIVSTATRVGMGNLVGVVAAISMGGAGTIFWMWVTALIGSATAFAEATLAQLHKQKDPLYGGFRGGPAYYIHDWVNDRRRARTQAGDSFKERKSLLAMLFALSGLICWCGVSQVVSNSMASSFENAFGITPIASTTVLVILSAIIVLRKNATVRVLDIVVPIMSGIYILTTIWLIITNFGQLGIVLKRIFSEAFGLRQAAAGGFGAVLMNGVKRGLFSNEAGSGSAPCAAAAAECSHPAEMGLTQALGVFIDTLICTCTAMVMLLAPEETVSGLQGMDLLQTAMNWHFGKIGVVFIAVILWLFCFSTFLGILFYARSNVAYLFGDNWASQTAYKIIALLMLFIGGLAAYTFVWDLGDVGVGLMTIFNLIALVPLSGQAVQCLKEYEASKMKE